jgi:hypothetical protein
LLSKPEAKGGTKTEWQKMAGRGRKNADDTLVLALACGKSVSDAAKTGGVSERSVYRRLDDPAFRKQIQSLRAEMLGQALGRMVDGMTDAADVLRTLLNAKSESVSLGACRALLELGVKLRDTVDLEERLAALEGKAADESKPKIPS